MKLIDFLPEYYIGNRSMEELQEVLSKKITSLNEAKSSLIDEVYIVTSSDLLERYEQLYGITPDSNQADEFRIEKIKAKIASVGTTTKEMIQNVSKSYSNGEVEVIEDNSSYRFKVKFVGILGVPKNIESLKDTIEEIKPAHLEVEFIYIYNTHGNLSKMTHLDMKKYNHYKLRNEVKV